MKDTICNHYIAIDWSIENMARCPIPPSFCHQKAGIEGKNYDSLYQRRICKGTSVYS